MQTSLSKAGICVKGTRSNCIERLLTRPVRFLPVFQALTPLCLECEVVAANEAVFLWSRPHSQLSGLGELARRTLTNINKTTYVL
jgi:hypothetical protein